MLLTPDANRLADVTVMHHTPLTSSNFKINLKTG